MLPLSPGQARVFELLEVVRQCGTRNTEFGLDIHYDHAERRSRMMRSRGSVPIAESIRAQSAMSGFSGFVIPAPSKDRQRRPDMLNRSTRILNSGRSRTVLANHLCRPS